MGFRARRPLTGRRLLMTGFLVGAAVFFVLVIDGAEFYRSGLAALAAAAWFITMIAGLNWYNRIRINAIQEAVAKASTDSEDETKPYANS